MTMSELSPPPVWQQMELPLTSYAAGSRVRIYPSLGEARGSTDHGQDYGPNMPDSLANYDRDTRSWRTSQRSLFGGFSELSETWPRSGMTRNGRLYPLPTWGRRTSASASGSSLTHKPTHHVPTPTASDYIERTCTSVQSPLNYETNKSVTLDRWVRMWPTPQAHDAALGNPARVGRYGTKHGGRNLNDEVALWPTPRSQTGGWPGASMEAVLRQVEKHGYNGRLEEAVY